MKKQILYISILFFITLDYTFGFSQEYDPYTFQDIKKVHSLKDKVFFGGGIDFQFGTYTVIKLTPEVGYRISPIFELGLGTYFLYIKDFSSNISTSIYGGKFFSRYYVFNSLVILGEYEVLFVPDYLGNRIIVPGLLGGVGYQQKLGDRFAVQTSILYNFLMSGNTPYKNPIIRISFVY